MAALNKRVGKYGNRSAFIEAAVLAYMAPTELSERDARDVAIYRKYARQYNTFAKSLLRFQVDPFE